MSGHGMRGFSLLEVVVAVALFSIAMGLAYGGLNAALRGRQQLQESGERLARIQLQIGLLERDVRSAMARSVRDEFGQVQPAMLLDSGRLALTRAGAGQALLRRRADLERVEWLWLDDAMRRRGSGLLDQPPTPLQDATSEIDGVVLIGIQAMDQQGRWHDQWPTRGQPPTAMPRALRWRARVEELGEIERLLELPAEIQSEPPA